MSKKLIAVYSACLFICFDPALRAIAQKQHYIDGRPEAFLRMPCQDAGIILRYGNGPDSCDILGAREAIVNRDKNKYYLYYDGAGKDGWIACLAESRDLKTWTKKGPILSLGSSGAKDARSASSPWVIKDSGIWHMFYVGAYNTSPPPNRIPTFPYLTLKAKSTSLAGPWIKQYEVTPFSPQPGTYYSGTSSPGFIVKMKDEYLQFFSGSIQRNDSTKRTLGIARTRDLNGAWRVDSLPVVPLSEQVENSSLFFEEKIKTWFLFTNHIGIDERGLEYTDAIWVYWSRDIQQWDVKNKAVVLDHSNCSWGKGAIGMPSVIRVGNRLALFYDAPEGKSTSHMRRNIGLAWLELPLRVPVSR